MKKVWKKLVAILVLVAFITSNVTSMLVAFASEVEKPNKGDVGLNETVTNNGESAMVSEGTLDNQGDVKVTKTVSKTNVNGRYKVEFKVEGKDKKITEATTKPVYAVVVFDRSGSMASENVLTGNCLLEDLFGNCIVPEYKSNNKWEDAKEGVKTFAKTLLGNIPNANVAVVAYSGSSDYDENGRLHRNAKTYDDASVLTHNSKNNSVFVSDTKSIDDLKFGNHNGGTNIYAGLHKANEILNSIQEDAYKYVVVISDGTPTFYYNNLGYTQGTGNSTNEGTYTNTIKMASTLKKQAEIFSIGYALDDEVVYTYEENGKKIEKKAADILQMIATADEEGSDIKHFVNADPKTVANAFNNIAEEIRTRYAGQNAVIIDNIGSNFTVVPNNDVVVNKDNDGNTNVTINIGDVVETGVVKSFYVDIDKDSSTGWFNTNEGFTLSYLDWEGKNQTINCNNNPQVYWEQVGTVIAHYVDLEGNTLSEDVITSGLVGDNYVTNSKNIDNYVLVGVEGNASGKYTKETIEVTYKYAKLGKLIVKYVDKNGNELLKSEETTKQVGTSYKTIQKNIDGYRLVSIEGNENGSYIDGTITVTYVYGKLGKLVVNYVDEAGNALINPLVNEEVVGTRYKTIQKEFKDYEFVRVDGNVEGSYEDGIITVVYNYTKKIGNLIVRYVDEDGKDIIDAISSSEKVGTNYKTIQKEFDDYEFVEVKGNTTGEYTAETTEVIYIYNKKSGKLVVKYVDENGNELADTITTTEKVGTTYKTTSKEIKDYELLKVEGNETGSYINGTITVTYVYTNAFGNVDVPEEVIPEPPHTGVEIENNNNNNNVILYFEDKKNKRK